MSRRIAVLLVLVGAVAFALTVSPRAVAPAPLYGNIPVNPLHPNVWQPPMIHYPLMKSAAKYVADIPDTRTILGTPGKNIAGANDGSSAAVILSQYSGDQTNHHLITVAYTQDQGGNWASYGPLSVVAARRVYPTIDAETDFQTGKPVYISWHEAVMTGTAYSTPSKLYYSVDEGNFPNGVFKPAYEMPKSVDYDVWMPCIGVQGQKILLTAANNNTYIKNNIGYAWYSSDGGTTWNDGAQILTSGRALMAGMHFSIGTGGYVFGVWNEYSQRLDTVDIYEPYYSESQDYGHTWTAPKKVWSSPPFQGANAWWYAYDCVVVNNKPYAAMKFSRFNKEYGQLYFYEVQSGGVGNRTWKQTLLIGDPASDTGSYVCTYPGIAADKDGAIYVTAKAYLIPPGDSMGYPDVACMRRFADGSWETDSSGTYLALWNITDDRDEVDEGAVEPAYNVASVGDSRTMQLVYDQYTAPSSNPTPTVLYYNSFTWGTTPTTVTVVVPNGSDMWKWDEARDITWTSTGSIDHFRVKISYDGGTTDSTLVESIAASPYPWTVAHHSSVTCKVKVEALDAGNTVLASDWSDANFTIAEKGAVEEPVRGATAFALEHNRPNPFTGQTAIGYALPASGPARLAVYDCAGNLVRTLVSDTQAAGRHSAAWDGRDHAGRPVASGLYFYTLEAGKESATGKMLLVN